MLHFQLPEKLAQRRAVVAAQTIDGVEHRIEQAGFDVADIDAGLLYHLFLALARGFAQFAEPGPDPIDHLVIAFPATGPAPNAVPAAGRLCNGQVLRFWEFLP